MHRAERVVLGMAIVTLLAGGAMAWIARGSAILMELGAGAARVSCL